MHVVKVTVLALKAGEQKRENLSTVPIESSSSSKELRLSLCDTLEKIFSATDKGQSDIPHRIF